MSLINDALRRANKTTTEQKPGSHDTVKLKPIEYAQDRSLKSLLAVPLILVALVAIGGVLFWQFGTQDKQTTQTPASATKQTASVASPQKPVQQSVDQSVKTTPVAAPHTSVKPAVPAATPQAASTPAAASREPAPIVMNPAANPSSAAPASSSGNLASPQEEKPVIKEPPKWPELELQAIYFRLKNPTVMINGQNLNIGDYIQGVRVHAIDRESATLELEGIRKVYKTK